MPWRSRIITNNWVRVNIESSFLCSLSCDGAAGLFCSCWWIASIIKGSQDEWQDWVAGHKGNGWIQLVDLGGWILCPLPLPNPPFYNTSHKNGISFDISLIMVSCKSWKKSYMSIYFTACSFYSSSPLQSRINLKSDFISR
jgi:hypothetical protein